MNVYSRALRYINIKDVKQKHQEKIVEQKIKEENERQEKEFIASVMETKKYDWRKELNEGMTSSGMFFTTLPATGDVNLLSPPLNSPSSHNASIVGGIITISGDPSPYSSNGAALTFDARQYDTLKFNVSIPPGAILGFLDLSGPSTNVLLAVLSSGTYTLTIPPNLRTSNFELILDTPDSVTMSVSNFTFQRRTPLNVFVSLDSPEATSFIRTEPNLSNLSPQQRLQKLKEMLNASDEYVLKILGKNFPGTGAVPPGEYDPFKQAPEGNAGDTPGVELTYYQNKLSAYEKALAANKQKSDQLSRAVDAARAEYLKPGTKTYAQIKASYAKLQAAIKAGTDYALSGLKNPIIKPTPPTPPKTQSTPPRFTQQQLDDIDKQIKDLQRQSEKSKQDAINNQWRAAAELALGALQAAAILSPIPGDEAIVAAGLAAKTGPKAAGAFARANPGKYNPFLSQQSNKYFNLPKK